MVAGTKPLRTEMRRQVNDAILDAARDLTVSRGWGNVTMSDVAAAAGVSRRTVYNEFANRDRLADAMVARELDGFTTGIRRVLEGQGDDVRAAIEQAVAFALTQAAANPLVEAALAGSSPEEPSLLPYLTTGAHVVLQGATELIADYARCRLAHIPPDRLAFGAEVLARVVVSNIVLPLAPPEEVAADLADLAVRYLDSLAAD